MSPPHIPPIISKSLFSLCNGNPLPTSCHRTYSFTQNRRTECHYPIPFPCRFSINSLESTSISIISATSAEIHILLKFSVERMSLSIQMFEMFSLVLAEPHTGHQKCHGIVCNLLVSIFALDLKSLMFHALGSTNVKRVLSKLFLESQ